MFLKIIPVAALIFFIMLKAVFSQMAAMNAEISSLVRPNWEFESFWAIPRIGETKPLVAISFSNKKDAMKYEYFLKNNIKLRLNIKQDFLNTI